MGLRELRKQRGLTVRAVAVLTGVDPATITRIEKGRAKATPEQVVRLAKALRIDAIRLQRLMNQASTAA